MRAKDPKGARDFSHRWEVRGSSERTPLPKGPTFRHHRSHPHFYSTFGQNGAGTRTRQLRQVTPAPCQVTPAPRQLPPALPAKEIRNQSHFLEASRELPRAILNGFGNEMGPKMEPTWSQNGAKMAPKRIPDRVLDSELVFGPIFIDF